VRTADVLSLPDREDTNLMRDAVIIGAVRSPVGRRNGGLAGLHPVDLSAQVLHGLVGQAGFDPGLVEDVIWGCVTQVGEQGLNVGRQAVLAAGWPEEIPATTVDRQCGSSQQAVHFAAAGVAAGHYDVVVAGGVESMTRVPMFSNVIPGPGEPVSPGLRARYGDSLVPQGVSAELIAEKWAITRDEADQISLTSHERAAAAGAGGRFEAEIVPVTAPGPDGPVTLTSDEGIRPDSSLEKLGALRPVFQEAGIVTAGNSSQISDGAAALLITTGDVARRLGVRPLARLHAFSVVGVDPVTMLTGPVPATQRVLDRAGLKLSDIGAFEINEAFATVLSVWQREIGADPALVNPNGGAIALGHPLGASGARLMTTLVHHMAATGAQFGLQSMCEGAGMANATILERL
jgi:acetyl-CoA acyltransferase